jgi:hypothetical protein
MTGVDERTHVGEVLDLGVVGDAPDGPPPPRRPLSRRALLMGGGGVALAGAGALALRTPKPPPPPPPPAPVSRGQLSGPVAGVPPGWQLFGLGTDVVVRLDLASSAVTQTRIPPLGGSQVFVVPGRRRVVVRPIDSAGWLVRDDEAASPLPSSLAGVGPVLPGPDLDHVWIQTREQATTSMALVNADGWGSLPVVVPVPQFATTGPVADGAGGLFFEGVGGLYRISPAGRLTTSDAIVLAVGRGDLLALARAAGGVWRPVLQLRGGATKKLPVPIGPQLPHGVLAPDGSSVVLYAVDERRRTTLTVVDLPGGDQRPVDVDITGVAGDGTVIWSPDGGRLFCLDTDGRVRVADPTTGEVTDTLDLPPLRQLAARLPG